MYPGAYEPPKLEGGEGACNSSAIGIQIVTYFQFRTCTFSIFPAAVTSRYCISSRKINVQY